IDRDAWRQYSRDVAPLQRRARGLASDVHGNGSGVSPPRGARATRQSGTSAAGRARGAGQLDGRRARARASAERSAGADEHRDRRRHAGAPVDDRAAREAGFRDVPRRAAFPAGGAALRRAAGTDDHRRGHADSADGVPVRALQAWRHDRGEGLTPRAAAQPRTFSTIDSSRDRERLRTVVLHEHEDLAALVAERIMEVIQRETRAKGKVVLGLATGSTPLGVYEELIRRHQAGEVDFARVITFNLDEYYPMSRESSHSYHRYMWENFFAHVNIAKENVHIPDGTIPRERVAEACAAFEEAIRAAGGIDFQLLGIGKTGHIGFNEPGSDAASRTRIVTLDTLTRRDAAADFFGVENVPREAITMGVATILDAREIALMATGEHKSGIVVRAVEGDISPDVAATFLQRHTGVTVYLDLAAAAELTRIKTPWVLEASGVDWNPGTIERSVVWLAERVSKAVLKLSAR